MIKDNCRGTFLLHAHKFRPRYDEKWTGPQWLLDAMTKETLTKMSGQPTRDHIKTYVHDVCVRCGSVVER